VPNYDAFKLFVLLYLLWPTSEESRAGSSMLYANIVAPPLHYFEEDLDEFIDTITATLKEVFEELIGVFGSMIGNRVVGTFKTVLSLIGMHAKQV
jgi:hypothetical protein